MKVKIKNYDCRNGEIGELIGKVKEEKTKHKTLTRYIVQFEKDWSYFPRKEFKIIREKEAIVTKLVTIEGKKQEVKEMFDLIQTIEGAEVRDILE